MGYTSVPHVAAGNIYTPTMYNTFLSDNFDSGVVRMLADSTLVGSAASIDFTSIPATFAHLMLVVYARSDAVTSEDLVNLRFNGDSGGNYDNLKMTWSGVSPSAAETFAATFAEFGRLVGASGGANLFGSSIAIIQHYTGAANNKTLTSQAGSKFGVAANNLRYWQSHCNWRSNAAINRVTLLPGSGNFVAGSRATLYGLPQ